MVNRILLVGQAPSKDTEGKAPFTGKSGKRLAEWAGLEHDRLGEVFELRNLFNTWPGKNGKGDGFDPGTAGEAADRMRPELKGRKVILVGLAVAQAFEFRDRDPFKWFEYGKTEWVLIPHPSGVNLLYNDPEMRAKAQGVLKEAATHV